MNYEYKENQDISETNDRLGQAIEKKNEIEEDFTEYVSNLFSNLHQEMDNNNEPALIQIFNHISEVFSDCPKLTDIDSFTTSRIPLLCFNILEFGNPGLVLSMLQCVNTLTKIEDLFEDFFINQEHFVDLLLSKLDSDNFDIISNIMYIISHLMHHSNEICKQILEDFTLEQFHSIFEQNPDYLYDPFSFILYISSFCKVPVKEQYTVLLYIDQLYKLEKEDIYKRLIFTLKHTLINWEGKLLNSTFENTELAKLLNYPLVSILSDEEEYLMAACDCVTLLGKFNIFPEVDYERIKNLTTEDETSDQLRTAAFNTILAIIKYQPSVPIIDLDYISLLIDHLHIVPLNMKETMIKIILGFATVSEFSTIDQMVANGFLRNLCEWLQYDYSDVIIENCLFLLRKMCFEYAENENEEYLGFNISIDPKYQRAVHYTFTSPKENDDDEESIENIDEENENDEDQFSPHKIIYLVKKFAEHENNAISNEAVKAFSALTELPNVNYDD